MAYLGELIALLVEEEVVTLWGPGGQVLMIAGPSYLVGPAQEGDAHHDGWAVVDYQHNPLGTPYTASTAQDTAALMLDYCGSRAIPVRRLLARRAYERLFPAGSSMDWPVAALSDWRPPRSWRQGGDSTCSAAGLY